ncbi:MAG: tyrosine-type recombinase/integrase [Pseudomonadota bacterium]|nr:tyrosine-type recombinase/integrase [Pseudomonadota bacterium]MDP1905024.1 tyrosine-type recombinase/integrase [Pseudomonadota bacterium]MDP2354266.1 tyrosine-type recombinase/integrase [Pseudomonadota bacterium]
MPKANLPPGVHLKDGRYYRVQYIGMVEGKRKKKWHALTRAIEGLAALYRALAELESQPAATDSHMPKRVTTWLQQTLPGLSAAEQKEVARMAAAIAEAFSEFRVEQIQAKHVLLFLNQWTLDGKLRTAQRYRAQLAKFFRWCIVQGDRADSPVDAIRLKAPAKHDRYITDVEYLAIRDKLLGNDEHAAASGPMMQVFVDLLYLTGQRGQDIRLLRWTQVDEDAGVIRFKPSKTATSSGAKVDVPITAAIADVLARARAVSRSKTRISPYIIHNLTGDAYSAHGVGTAWERARKRAGIEDATLKDLRAKHATDAKRAGYSDEDIQDSLAHEDTGTTRIYLKQRMAKLSRVALSIPGQK